MYNEQLNVAKIFNEILTGFIKEMTDRATKQQEPSKEKKEERKKEKKPLGHVIDDCIKVLDANQDKILIFDDIQYKEIMHHNPKELFKIMIKRCALVFDSYHKTHIFDRNNRLWYIRWDTGQPDYVNYSPEHLYPKHLKQFSFFRMKSEAIASIIYFKDLRDKVYKTYKNQFDE
jgi:hypothetical protein